MKSYYVQLRYFTEKGGAEPRSTSRVIEIPEGVKVKSKSSEFFTFLGEESKKHLPPDTTDVLVDYYALIYGERRNANKNV